MGLADLCGFEPGGIPEEDSDYSNINQPSLSHVFQENYNISSQAFEYPPSSKVDTMSSAAKSVHARKVPIPEVEKISKQQGRPANRGQQDKPFDTRLRALEGTKQFPPPATVSAPLRRSAEGSKGRQQERPMKPKSLIRLPSVGEPTGFLDPSTLLPDDGGPFPKKLLTQFKAYRVTCAIVKKVKKQPHRVAQYLILHERLNPPRLGVHDEAGTLSYALLLHLAKFELEMRQNRKKLPPVPEPVVTLPQPTEVEQITAFNQEIARGVKRQRESILMNEEVKHQTTVPMSMTKSTQSECRLTPT